MYIFIYTYTYVYVYIYIYTSIVYTCVCQMCHIVHNIQRTNQALSSACVYFLTRSRRSTQELRHLGKSENAENHVSSVPKPWLFRVYRGYILPSYIGIIMIIISQYRDLLNNQYNGMS